MKSSSLPEAKRWAKNCIDRFVLRKGNRTQIAERAVQCQRKTPKRGQQKRRQLSPFHGLRCRVSVASKAELERPMTPAQRANSRYQCHFV
jgi:hypothetical protein